MVADAATAIRTTIAAIEKPRPVLPQFDELAARAQALRDTLPDALAPSVPAQVEEEMVMPQVVELERADLSAIPDFGPAVPEPEPVVEAPAASRPSRWSWWRSQR